MGFLDPVLRPIMWVVAWIMYGSHKFFALFLDPAGGLSWILSIVVLVVVMRIIMIPLFVKQIRSSRGMQLMQPELQKLQARYKGKTDPVSKRRQQEEMMEMYKKNGANPFSSCLPVLAQSPFFFALFRVLYNLGRIANGQYQQVGPITQGPGGVAKQIESSTLFGAPLSATFLDQNTWAGANPWTVRAVTVLLIVAMSVTTFTTQRQLTMKNMPQTAMDNPMFRTQKIMMYAMPGVFAVSGVNFPIGVLIYWLTTNVWSMGQQFIVIRRMPAPGSEAEKRMLERKAKKHPKKVEEDTAVVIEVEAPKGQRVQPKKTTRSQRRSGPLQASNPSPATPGPLDEAEPQDGHTAEEPTGGAEATPGAGAGIPSDGAEKASGQRNQPKSTSRKKRKK